MTRDFVAGDYRFIPAVFQFSSGVAALPGHEIVRVRFSELLPLADGFARAAELIRAEGRPLTAFCACELRSPAAFSEAGFRAFNAHYVKTLAEWGIFDGAVNPVARSNVCPEIDPPREPSFHAFSFTRPKADGAPTFVIAGGAEARGGDGPYAERIVRYRDASAGALREKIGFVVGEMARRMALFEADWAGSTGVQIYTIHDFHAFAADELVRQGAGRFGMTWHYARPPVIDLEYEMDCRRVMTELVI